MHPRRFALLILVLAVAAVLQSGIIGRIRPLGARPDLVLLLVVAISVLRGMEYGLMAGILGGLMVDILSATPFGSATLGMGFAGLATGLGESNMYRANLLVPLVAVFLATVFYHSFLLLALQAAGWSVEWISTLALQTVPGAALNAVLSPLSVPVARWVVASTADEEQIR